MTIQTDLFTHKSAKNRLYDFIKQRRYVRSSEVLKWGAENFCTVPGRRARELAQEGKIRRMPESKKRFYFGNTKEKVWEIVKFPQAIL